jgi:phosphoribosyl-AMP cyclohydrolase
MSPIDPSVINDLSFNDQGLIPAIVQSETGRVLMLAWMNAESIRQTLEIEQTVFFSRSRNEIWHKGATSGNTQQVLKIELDCDGDALLIQVREAGVACHTGTESCFDVETLFISEDD